MRRILRRLENFIVPPPEGPGERRDDYRPVISLMAVAAVGFFIPSLLIASVPTDRWLPFTVLALAAGVWIAGTFFVRQPPQARAVAFAIANSLIVAGLGFVYRDYYHETPMLFALLIAAHAVIHGLGVATIAVAAGSLMVPLVMQDLNPTLIGSGGFNGTDPVYTVIYLFGVALVSWTASRLAANRLAVVRRQLTVTLEAEREAVYILARAAEAKDEVTGDHVGRVGTLAAALGERIGLDKPHVEDLRFAAMLHDVGKLHVPDGILMKPGRLTPEEWQIVRAHTIWGERILGTTRGFSLARGIARSHHENWDGSGYPDGLMGDGIPLSARIVHLADVFDALRNVRPYKPAWTIERCMDEIRAYSEKFFDPELAREFLRMLEDHPQFVTPPAPSGPLQVEAGHRLTLPSSMREPAAATGSAIPVLLVAH